MESVPVRLRPVDEVQFCSPDSLFCLWTNFNQWFVPLCFLISTILLIIGLVWSLKEKNRRSYPNPFVILLSVYLLTILFVAFLSEFTFSFGFFYEENTFFLLLLIGEIFWYIFVWNSEFRKLAFWRLPFSLYMYLFVSLYFVAPIFGL